MSDPGLSHRLRQRSRRAGLMIGLSMLLTIAVCAVGFTVIYSALDTFTSDFISRSEETPTPAEQVVAQNTDTTGGAENPPPEQNAAPETPDPADTEAVVADTTDNQLDGPAPTEEPAEGTAAEDGFNPDYQLRGVTVNLRSGPSTSDSIVTALPPSTPLEYLDEDAPTQSSQDGERWMRFTTEDGLEGWIREIDVAEYEP